MRVTPPLCALFTQTAGRESMLAARTKQSRSVYLETYYVVGCIQGPYSSSRPCHVVLTVAVGAASGAKAWLLPHPLSESVVGLSQIEGRTCEHREPQRLTLDWHR